MAATDWMKSLPDMVARWLPPHYLALGTDGFGRSDTRENLRRFFEVDASSVVVATLYALAQKGAVPRETVAQAIKDLGVDPEKTFPVCV